MQAFIDPCTRVPKNNKIPGSKALFHRVRLCLYTSTDSHQYPVFTAIQSFKMFAEDLLSITRHLTHYIAQYCNKGELTRVSCLFLSKIKPHKILDHDEFLKFM